MFRKKLKIFKRLFYKNIALTRSLSEKGDICLEQLKAARSLLNWSQEDLAKKSGYSLATINNIERGQYNAHSTTMADIVQTFEQAGVQFIDGPGVKIEEADFRIKAYEGEQAIRYLFSKIGLALEESENEGLYISGIDESFLKQKTTEKDLKVLFKRLGKKIPVRILCHKNQSDALGFLNFQKKIVSDMIPLIPCFIYRNRVALVILQNPTHVTILYNESLAEVYKALFDHLWKTTK
ncbi:MAG: helix-turn-helix domain-containing protein [Alphaproteobacteria bacterium]|nr:helix-turn-helix domain-containing protein [Alphaproteobacteria bacterium]